MKSTLKDFGDWYAAMNSISKAKGRRIVTDVFTLFAEYLLSHDEVQIPDLGTFKQVVHNKRVVFTPITERPVEIEEKTHVKFREAATLCRKLNGFHSSLLG